MIFLKFFCAKWNWYVSLAIACLSTGLSWFYSLPLCLACLSVQALLWLRLCTQSRKIVSILFFCMLAIQGTMLPEAWTTHWTCPFDVTNLLPACQSAYQIQIMGQPFVFWSFLGTVVLFLWSLCWKD